MFHYIAVAVYMKTRMMDNHLIVIAMMIYYVNIFLDSSSDSRIFLDCLDPSGEPAMRNCFN